MRNVIASGASAVNWLRSRFKLVQNFSDENIVADSKGPSVSLFRSMKLKKNILSLGVLSSLFYLATPGLAEVVLPKRCFGGYCRENTFLSKTLIEENTRGKLYSVEVMGRAWPERSYWEDLGQEIPDPAVGYGTYYVHCSTSKPALIFSRDDGSYRAHLLNPGGMAYGYNMSDYPIYWVTCYNFVGPDFFSDEMTSRAVELGYSLNLPSEGIDLGKPVDIMN